MTRRWLGLVVLLTVAAGIGAWAAAAPEAGLQETLRYRLEFDADGRTLAVAGERIQALTTLRRFYLDRLYRPAWAREGEARIGALVSAIRASRDHGLTPGDYHLDAIERLRQRLGDGADADVRADLDLLLTDAFLLLGSHLHSGRLEPTTIEPAWTAQRPDADLAGRLQQALAENGVQQALDALAPPQARYRRLQRALAEYRRMAENGWPRVEPGPSLQPGADDPRVRPLRRRLAATGDWQGGEGADETLYTPELVAAVEAFQRRHGLTPDGIVGAATTAALNESADARVQRIRANLERWRWLPQALGEPHIEVNIPAFTLALMEAGRPAFEAETIVGRTYRQTPLFSGRMTYLVLNPYWEVPPSLARQDLLPKIKADPGFLDRMGMEVLQGWGTDERRIDPARVDWAAVSAAGMRFRLRQAPGPQNALGRVKFMFPNRHNVYIHDTPSRELFARSRRDFSSGCIRTSRPLELAARLLAPNGGWPLERLQELAAGGGRTLTVPLERPVDVHLLYWTAWQPEAGGTQFRDDIYRRDQALLDALDAPPPRPRTEARS